MRILLVCAGGASTGILLKKLKKYAEEKALPLESIEAVGMGEYEDCYQQFDVILMGPQISYKKAEIERVTKRPVAIIAPYDYAIGNAEHIFKQIDGIFPSK